MNKMQTARDFHGRIYPVNPVCLNANEIIGKFAGADQLRTVVNQLQSLLYPA